MISLNPSVQSPEADITVTGVGPVTKKLVPLAAIVLQLIFLLKCNFISSGAQPTLATLSMGMGVGIKKLNAVCSAAGIARSQLSSSVLTSVPSLITSW